MSRHGTRGTVLRALGVLLLSAFCALSFPGSAAAHPQSQGEKEEQLGRPLDHEINDHAGHDHAGHDHAGHDHGPPPSDSFFDLHDYEHPAPRPAYDRLEGSRKPRHQRETLLTAGILKNATMAASALSRREYQEAEGLYRGALRECWLALGSIEVAAGRLAEAHRAFDHAATSTAEPALPERLTRALLRLWTGEMEAAIGDLHRLSTEHPDDLELRAYYVHALATAGPSAELEEQLETLRQALPDVVAKIETSMARAQDDPVARLAALRPRIDVGILLHKSSSELAGSRARVQATRTLLLRNLAVLHRGIGRAERAQSYESLAEATEIPEGTKPLPVQDLGSRGLPPEIAPLSVAAGMLWKSATTELLPFARRAGSGDLADTTAELRRLLRSPAGAAADPGDGLAAIHDMLGILLAEQGEHDEAVEHFAAALALEPDFASTVRDHRIRLEWTRGRTERGMELLRDASAHGPLARDLTLALAERELAVAGREEAARTALWAAAQRYRSVRALLALARLDARTDGPEKGLGHLVQARDLAPSSEEILLELGRLHLAAGSAEQAIEPLESLHRMHPMVDAYGLLLDHARGQSGSHP